MDRIGVSLFKSLTFIFTLTAMLTVWAAPLTVENIQRAKNIGFMTGVFDPWSEQDLANAKKALASGEIDLLIVLPVDDSSVVFPLPAAKRIDLIEVGVKLHPQIFTPGIGFDENAAGKVSELVKKIKSINPQTKITAVRTAGQKKYLHLPNIVLDSSNLPAPPEDIKNFMFNNSELYFEKNESKILPQGIQAEVFEKIRADGLYLGRQKSTGVLVKKTLAFLTQSAQKVKIFDPIRLALVKALAKPDLKEFIMGDKLVKVEKYLGSGLNGDAFVVTVDGNSTVLKVAKPSVMAKQSMQQATLVHAWISKNYNINLPELLTFDEAGTWQALELVKGERLDNYIALNGGKIPPTIDANLRKFHAEAARLNATSDIKLDISADNIFIRADGQPVLVDFGPTQPYQRFASDYKVASARWLEAGELKMKALVPPVKGNCIQDTFQAFLKAQR
jgi:hypothetical protein